jgi:anti-sigma factor RsiW
VSATHDDLACAAAVELVTAYLEGALDAAARARFEEHLADCPGCTIYLEQMRQTIATTGRLAESDVPEPLRQRLRDAFRGWQSGA